MSCDAVASAAFLWLAAMGPAPDGSAPERPAMPQSAVALEPLFADIVKRAGALKAEVEAAQAGRGALAGDFGARVTALAALDLEGHKVLAARGTDGDLKCILRGISEDLGLKLKALEAAGAGPARAEALTDLAYLLNDNVEVITAPPAPPV